MNNKTIFGLFEDLKDWHTLRICTCSKKLIEKGYKCWWCLITLIENQLKEKLSQYYKGFNIDCVMCAFKDKSFNEIMKSLKGENK